MRIHMTDEREQRYERLLEATGENTKSGAIDKAAIYYSRMAGTNVRQSEIAELLELAEQKGSLTAPEIADALDCPQLPVSATVEHSVGEE